MGQRVACVSALLADNVNRKVFLEKR